MKRACAALLAVIAAFGQLLFGAADARALNMTYTPSSYFEESTYHTQLRSVILTGDQRTDIVNVALSQMGYHEGDCEEDLGGSYSGSSDYTEYGFWWGTQVLGEPYGSHGAWCAEFVSWCARQAQVPTSVLKNSSGANCSPARFDLTYYSGASYTPQPGDLFFKTNWTHVGIVRSVNGTQFTTVEGNCSNMVKSRTLNIEDYYFGVPEYNTAALSYSIEFEANGGSGSIPGFTVLYDGDLSLPGNDCGISNAGFLLVGWSVQRASDEKWFTEANGWETEASMALNGHSKRVFPADSSWILDSELRSGGEMNDTLVFHAVWMKEGALTGDADCSGEVNFADVTFLYIFLLGLDEMDEQGRLNADVDGSGRIDFVDVTMLYSMLLMG